MGIANTNLPLKAIVDSNILVGLLNPFDHLITVICREYQISAIISYDADFDQIPWLTRIAKPEDLTR
jgi:predicted nucleic acid-binding protein